MDALDDPVLAVVGWAMGGGRFNCGCDNKLHLSVVEFGLSHNGWHLAGQMHQ